MRFRNVFDSKELLSPFLSHGHRLLFVVVNGVLQLFLPHGSLTYPTSIAVRGKEKVVSRLDRPKALLEMLS